MNTERRALRSSTMLSLFLSRLSSRNPFYCCLRLTLLFSFFYFSFSPLLNSTLAGINGSSRSVKFTVHRTRRLYLSPLGVQKARIPRERRSRRWRSCYFNRAAHRSIFALNRRRYRQLIASLFVSPGIHRERFDLSLTRLISFITRGK